LGLSKTGLLNRMRKYNFFAEAAALRAEANLIGPRKELPASYRRQRRAQLIALLSLCDWNVGRAHKHAGVSAGTFYNMMRELEIDRPALERPHRLHRLIDALRLARGVMWRAAQHLGVEQRTVRKWCVAFDVDPREYRA
jgi:transcriptional regulator of acetoin/glycerol metabolism